MATTHEVPRNRCTVCFILDGLSEELRAEYEVLENMRVGDDARVAWLADHCEIPIAESPVHRHKISKHRELGRYAGAAATVEVPDSIGKNDALGNIHIEGDDQEFKFTGLPSKNPLDPSDIGAFAMLFKLAGLDPKEYRLVKDSLKFSTWQQSARSKSGDRDLSQQYSYSGTFQRVNRVDAEVDQAMLRIIERTPFTKPVARKPLTRVVVIGDMQIGKVDSRGGTDDLIERYEEVEERLSKIMVAEPCEEAVVADPGDLIEGFSNTSSQLHNNDLSLPTMLRMGRMFLTRHISTVSAFHRHTRVITVPSNHARWSEGKSLLGKPCDDFGVDTHRAVSEAFAMADRPVEWVFPASEWDESLALDVRGARIGLVHGHQAKPGQFATFWRGQALGSQPLASCNIAISGHYHAFRCDPMGFMNGMERTHFQGLTLDNGSAWFRNLTGEDSAPGLFTFTVDDEGHWDNLHLVQQPVPMAA